MAAHRHPQRRRRVHGRQLLPLPPPRPRASRVRRRGRVRDDPRAASLTTPADGLTAATRNSGALCQTSRMADFSRTSRIVELDELDQSLLDAIQATLARHELDIVLLDVMKVCRTESTPLKRRWVLGPRRRAHTTGDRPHADVARLGDRRERVAGRVDVPAHRRRRASLLVAGVRRHRPRGDRLSRTRPASQRVTSFVPVDTAARAPSSRSSCSTPRLPPDADAAPTDGRRRADAVLAAR